MSDTPILLLAIDLDGDGAHPAAWRRSGRAPAAVLGGAAVRADVLAAEAAGYTFATFADTPVPPNAVDGLALESAGRIEAGTRAAFVATTTDRLGLAPTLHATTTEPFHLATQLASLDYATRGRGAWVVGAANDIAARATIGAKPLTATELTREITDVIDVARLLWDSWEDDAVIRDVPTGRYLDKDRVHHVDFDGAAFSIKGPLITPRPPQGQVVVIAADHLDVDSRADVVLVARPDIAAITTRAAQAREAGAARVFAEVEVVLNTPEESAVQRLSELDAAAQWGDCGALRFTGSAEELVQLLISLAGVVDGVRLHPAVLSIDAPLLADVVIPGLAAAGHHRTPHSGSTLRESLGLSRPVNHFALAAITH